MEEQDFKDYMDFMQYGVQLAQFSPYNLETGFITGQVCNEIGREEILEKAQTLRFICNETAKQIEKASEIFNQAQAGLIFQYFFDRSVEIFYKKYNDLPFDDVNFNINEVFEYYEPDLPYNVQQILTNRVGNIAVLTSKVWKYMEENLIFEKPIRQWFANYLYLAVSLGLAFAREIDFDDESELNRFLNPD